MTKSSPLLLITAILISACSAIPGKPPVAMALGEPQQPFQTGVQIAKPTYTAVPTATFTPSAPPPTDLSAPVSTEAISLPAFAEGEFTVIENLSPLLALRS